MSDIALTACKNAVVGINEFLGKLNVLEYHGVDHAKIEFVSDQLGPIYNMLRDVANQPVQKPSVLYLTGLTEAKYLGKGMCQLRFQFDAAACKYRLPEIKKADCDFNVLGQNFQLPGEFQFAEILRTSPRTESVRYDIIFDAPAKLLFALFGDNWKKFPQGGFGVSFSSNGRMWSIENPTGNATYEMLIP